MPKSSKIKARYWWAVLYPENMSADWQEEISEVLQLPFAYCVHNADKDSKGDERKEHVHVILAFPNTTTYARALEIFDRLSASGKTAVNTCESIVSVRHAYDYLIHDTDACRKAGKKLYDACDRVSGNNFDIGAYEQLSTAEKNEMRRELGNICLQGGFTTYADFYAYANEHMSTEQLDIVIDYSAFFERLTRGIYHSVNRKL